MYKVTIWNIADDKRVLLGADKETVIQFITESINNGWKHIKIQEQSK